MLVALDFTHPAHADAQQKFSFQGVSYNGDIKPEQFRFSDVSVKARSYTDRVNIKVIFQDVSTPYLASDKKETVAITIEGDPESETVYALRLEYGTFSQTIPSTYSYEGKSSRFLIAPKSIHDGKFNSLYEQLTAHDKTKLKGVCNYFLDDDNIKKISEVIGLGNGAIRINKLLSNPNVSKQIKTLATLCYEATNRVYVKDVQTFLNALGYNVGKNDGQWGAKSKKAWMEYLSSNGKSPNTAINNLSVQKLQKSINSKIPELREITFIDGYFDFNGSKSKHTKSVTELCNFISCKLSLNRWHDNARKEIYEIQTNLNYAGFDAGVPNGLMGNKTLIAIRNYYSAKNKKFDGVISENEFNEIVRYASNPSFRIFNDFSKMIYKSGISIQPSGHHPSAVKVSNGKAKFTLTPKMYSNYSRNIQRFEIGKKQIPEHLALKVKFKFKSDNKVSDRVLIAQIKSSQKKFGGVGPMASVYIDRSPQCATWNRNKYYPEKYDFYVDKPVQHSTKSLLVYSERRKNGLYEYVWSDRKAYEINRSFKPLNDGKCMM